MTRQTDASEGADIRERKTRVRRLSHTALIFLALNVLVGMWFYFSPSLPPIMKPVVGQQISTLQAHKESPFAPVLSPNARRAVKMPRRIEPVVADGDQSYAPGPGIPVGNRN